MLYEVLKLLKGDQTRVKEIKLNEGDLQLFKGKYAFYIVQQERKVIKLVI